ncbi:MAG: inorganic phosphate transporter, partial [Chlamydiae bacterium]|nr:inorganic phosphate transporter [Chlamydiota bacterium]
SLVIGALAFLAAHYLVQRMSPPATTYPRANYAHPQNTISLEKAVKHLQRVQSNSTDAIHKKVSGLLLEARFLSQELQKESCFSEVSSEYKTVEKMFVFLQVLSACFIAFAHGANDVANAIGPVAAVLDVIKHGSVSEVSQVPSWLLAFGGFGIVVGLATWGWRVMETIGKKITELTPTRGFCAEFSAAIVILIASKLGLPISTTHCIVGAVLGIGFAKGMRALNLSMIREIVLSWIITIPASAGMSILVYYFCKTFLVPLLTTN